MSAITGIFYRDGHLVENNEIKQMNDRISHRGPDGSDVWVDGSVALGHQMLWTTPESLHEKLPYVDESGLVITADARIDNRDELSKLLKIRNEETVPDSLFILRAYEKWGETCPEKLLGDFAFVIWDKNNTKMFCARDHMGVKPFYYYLSDDAFFFATELKAFSTIIEEFKLNKLKIAFFLKNFLDKKLTFYNNILNLTPAHYLVIDQNKNKKESYWRLDPDFQIKMDSDEDYFKKFREIFYEAVNCRLRTAFPVGYDLSGGLDSSSVVCMAKKILGKDTDPHLNTFSYTFDDLTECDERYYIKKVTDRGGIKSHWVKCDNISPLEQVETILRFEDRPFRNPFMPMRLNLFKKMQKNGMRLLLSGVDGDTVISHGQKYFIELAVNMKWNKLINELICLSKRTNKSFYREFVANVLFPLIPEYLKNWMCHFTKKISCTSSNFINKELENKLNLNEEIQKRDPHLNAERSAKEYHYYLIHMSSNQNFLEEIDPAAAYFSIEPRYPFYDKRLIEFCYAIPTEMKFRSGWDRFIQRAALNDILPAEIQWRPGKVNFTTVLRRNFLLFEKNRLEKMIYDENRIIEGYIDLDKLKNIYQKYRDDSRISYLDLYNLWFVMVLFLWLKSNKT